MDDMKNQHYLQNHRALENPKTANRKDDILRAAISAFVALSKPTIRDRNQIEDLAGPIFALASAQTKRFVAAALAESQFAPLSLVKAICASPIEICAPLLLRSPVLGPVDLVALIGRNGMSHARVISQRTHLPHDVIEALALVEDPIADERISRIAQSNVTAKDKSDLKNIKPVTVDDAIDLLRNIMSVSATSEQSAPEFVFSESAFVDPTERFIHLALNEDVGLFATALADASDITYARALKIVRRTAYSELSVALRANKVSLGNAYLICSLLFTSLSANRSDVRLFKDRYEALQPEKARDMLRQWKADDISLELRRKGANIDESLSAKAVSA